MSSLITDWTCVPCTGRRVFNRWTTREVPLCIFLRNPSCFYGVSVCVLVAQLCLTLCDPMDCSPPGFSVHRILQARILEWVAISFSRGPSQREPASQVSCINSFFLLLEPPGKSAAAAKSLQSTLCNPTDGSPPGSPIPGILQARTLGWVAIFFSSAWKWKVKVKLLSRVRLFLTPWTAAYKAPLSMGFSRQEYWSGVSLLSPAWEAYYQLKCVLLCSLFYIRNLIAFFCR